MSDRASIDAGVRRGVDVAGLRQRPSAVPSPVLSMDPRPGASSSPISPAEFRACVGEFATGVAVVTVAAGEDAAGMTLNSFVSVSLDPLLVLVSLANASRACTCCTSGRALICRG